MKIYNETKTEILENVDLTKGYLINDKIIIGTIPEQEEVKEQFHYEYNEYPNGGKDRIKIIDVPYQPAKPETYEYEEIKIFIPYTEEEKAQMRIAELKSLLASTDYIANKLAEANARYIITEDKTELIELQTKYSKELANRQAWREEIDKLGG